LKYKPNLKSCLKDAAQASAFYPVQDETFKRNEALKEKK
jgi:hypothetical protein